VSEHDSLNALLREWKAPEPSAELDRRIAEAYRAAVLPAPSLPSIWQRFWKLQVSVPSSALVVAAVAMLILLLWWRPSPSPSAPAVSPEGPGVVTRLNATGFQPLPNGHAQVVPAVEVKQRRSEQSRIYASPPQQRGFMPTLNTSCAPRFPMAQASRFSRRAPGPRRLQQKAEWGSVPGSGRRIW